MFPTSAHLPSPADGHKAVPPAEVLPREGADELGRGFLSHGEVAGRARSAFLGLVPCCCGAARHLEGAMNINGVNSCALGRGALGSSCEAPGLPVGLAPQRCAP